MVNDPQNHQTLGRASIEGTPTLKFYCRGRGVGEHVGSAIEPVLKQKIDTCWQKWSHVLTIAHP